MSPLADKTNHLWTFPLYLATTYLTQNLKLMQETLGKPQVMKMVFHPGIKNRCLDFCVRFYLLEVSINTQSLEATVFNVIFI